MKKLFEKYREIIMYLVFGAATTLVGWSVYYAVMLGGRAVLAIPANEVTGGRYLALYTSAQIIQWIAAVLFAFFTNRKWVFTDADKSVPMIKQLGAFAGSRLVTFGIDYAITYGGTLLMGAIFPSLNIVVLSGREFNFNEIISKVIAAIIVIISNYIISKLLVFRKKKTPEA